MHDPVQFGHLTGVGENDGSKFPAVYLAIWLQDALAKGIHHRVPTIGMGCVSLVPHLVGVDDFSPKFL
jgi:hypothetical protein